MYDQTLQYTILHYYTYRNMILRVPVPVFQIVHDSKKFGN